MYPVWSNDGQAVLVAGDGVGLGDFEAVVHVDDCLKWEKNEKNVREKLKFNMSAKNVSV